MKKALVLLTLISSQLFSQDLKKSADALFAKQEWVKASRSYKEYLKENKSDSSAWYKLGISQMKSMDYESAVKSLNKANEYNYSSNFVQFNLIKTYALAGKKEAMYGSLENAVQNNFSVYKQVINDNVFSPFKYEERFAQLIERIKLNAYPCLSATNYRHFDFWLGEWDVYANGVKVGVNKITMAEGGCTIHENYTTAGNYSGQSMNYYDPIDKKWHQHWVGSSGDVYNYLETARSPGILQFQSKFMNGQGQISLSRLTFTLNEDKTVRQLFESSVDDGKTWTPAFDGLYKKGQ